MLSRATHAAPHRRGTVVTGIAAVVVAVTLGVAGVFSLHAPNAGARTAREAGVSRVAQLGVMAALPPASTLGAAVGTTTLGLRTSYYEPPALSDPQNPGAVVNSGPDQPDPFVFVQNGRYYMFTSQDRFHKTFRFVPERFSGSRERRATRYPTRPPGRRRTPCGRRTSHRSATTT